MVLTPFCRFTTVIAIKGDRGPEDLERQTEHFNRALRQITIDDPLRCKAYQCAELYYKEDGRLQTSKSVPLLWSQANLWTALAM